MFRHDRATLVSVALLVACAVCPWLAPAAHATSYVMVDDGDLADQADLVVAARVTGATVETVDGRPTTRLEVEVDRVLGGAAPGSVLTVTVPGGEMADGTGLEIWGAPELATGDRALLFLMERADGTFGPLHLGLGAFERVDAPGRSLALRRHLAEAREVAPAEGSANPDRHLARDFDGFADWLADRSLGLDRERDYLVRDAALPAIEKYTLTIGNGNNLRWRTFDTGGTVFWYALANGQPGLAGGGFAEFRQSLAVWNDDPGSRIRYSYLGTVPTAGGFTADTDGRNVILFDDPNSFIDGTFICGAGGTLAVGGPFYSQGPTHQHEGGTYRQIVEAEVVMNDGVECFIQRSSCPGAVAAEIYTHELGHTLGLGHSCSTRDRDCTSNDLDDATMRAQAHADCRGAAIRSDDRAAVAFLYRDPNGTGGGGGGGGPALPPAPTGLTATLEGSTVRLAWSDPADDETGFRVERATGGGGFAELTTTAADDTAFLDSTVAAGTTYRYRVRTLRGTVESNPGNVAQVTLPAAQPVTVALSDAQGSFRVGEPVEFVASVRGPGTEVLWDFDRGGAGYTETPCGATGSDDLYCQTHVFTEPGPHRVRTTVTGDVGQTATSSQTFQVTDAPWTPTERGSFLQSVILGPRGDTGTFRSDLWLHNGGDRPTVVRITFIPRGTGDDAPAPRRITLAPDQTVHLKNVLDLLFGLDRGQGSIAVDALAGAGAGAEPAIYAMGRSYVDLAGGANPAVGSFGQLVGEQLEETWSADDQLVTGILDGDGFVATLLAANLDDATGAVTVELLSATGASLGTATLGLGPRSMRFRPLRALFPAAGAAPGPFTARFRSNGIRFAASATLLETGSEDQIFLPARRPTTADAFVVPRAVRGPGQFGVFLESQLTVRNPSTAPTQLTFELLERGQDNRTPRTATRTVPPRGTLFLADVMGELFGLEQSTGALVVRWANAQNLAPRVVSLTLAQSPDGSRFGTVVDSRPATAGTRQGLDFGAEQSELFRSSYGVVNLASQNTRLRLTVRDAAGAQLASRQLTLAPRQQLERNLEGLFPGLGLGTGWSVETAVLAGGQVMTYNAQINASGDLFYVPGRSLQ